ncbi:MAG: LysR family transcriptional regulator, partial [Rhodobacterales bacterium]
HDRDQFIGRQVEAHLMRLKLDFPGRFEIGTHLTLMTLVARGLGWAITTPLGYMRAHRLQDQIEAHPLPFKPFARRISLFASVDWAENVPRDVARTMRHLVQDGVITPALQQMPWLQDGFRIED